MSRRPKRPERFRQAPGLRQEQVDEVLFLIDEHGRAIHSLLPIGAAVWVLLAEAASEREIIDLLQQAFPDAARSRIGRDVRELLADLRDQRLVIRAGEPDAGA
ncbi:PqqD family protein [Rhizobium sp. TRM95111]|uniref:PqqD family protein n=1 Tax=Rhizobium alarense TaxID=2846851 RepID=UPI001F43778F|nr:PqqD family protein [Rhizobium alarense]MCF3643353.1 PqqD family protein [Rhizobium alarense]